MATGKGGSKTSSTTTVKLDPTQQELMTAQAKGTEASTGMAERAFGAIEPVREQLGAQIGEALRTGGVGAQLPIIQQAVEQSRAATANTLSGQRQELARSGLTDTPFASTALAGTELKGNQQTAGIPSQLAQWLIAMAAPTFGGQAPQASPSGSIGPVSSSSTENKSGGGSFLDMVTSLFGLGKSGMDIFSGAKGLFGGGTGAAVGGLPELAGAII